MGGVAAVPLVGVLEVHRALRRQRLVGVDLRRHLAVGDQAVDGDGDPRAGWHHDRLGQGHAGGQLQGDGGVGGREAGIGQQQVLVEVVPRWGWRHEAGHDVGAVAGGVALEHRPWVGLGVGPALGGDDVELGGIELHARAHDQVVEAVLVHVDQERRALDERLGMEELGAAVPEGIAGGVVRVDVPVAVTHDDVGPAVAVDVAQHRRAERVVKHVLGPADAAVGADEVERAVHRRLAPRRSDGDLLHAITVDVSHGRRRERSLHGSMGQLHRPPGDGLAVGEPVGVHLVLPDLAAVAAHDGVVVGAEDGDRGAVAEEVDHRG